MNLAKSKWKSFLLLFCALVMIGTMVTGCSSEEEEKPTITIGDNMYESNWINNAVAQFIIEEGYGYPTELITVSTPVLQVSLVNGDILVQTELWVENLMDWYTAELAAGSIEQGGVAYAEGGPQFWIIPQWLSDEYNIKTIDDMKDNWELFKDPEHPNKGLFVNSITGWQCTAINLVKMEAYGLTDYYNIMSTGSGGALDAALVGPYKQHKAVFGYYWSPTAIMGAYDWYILEEPAYDEAVWNKVLAAKDDDALRATLTEACEYPHPPIHGIFNKELKNIAPDIREMLLKYEVGLDRMNATAAWCVENEIQDYELAAVWYLQNYEDVWKTWVTTDAYNKIKKALEGR